MFRSLKDDDSDEKAKLQSEVNALAMSEGVTLAAIVSSLARDRVAALSLIPCAPCQAQWVRALEHSRRR